MDLPSCARRQHGRVRADNASVPRGRVKHITEAHGSQAQDQSVNNKRGITRRKPCDSFTSATSTIARWKGRPLFADGFLTVSPSAAHDVCTLPSAHFRGD